MSVINRLLLADALKYGGHPVHRLYLGRSRVFGPPSRIVLPSKQFTYSGFDLETNASVEIELGIIEYSGAAIDVRHLIGSIVMNTGSMEYSGADITAVLSVPAQRMLPGVYVNIPGGNQYMLPGVYLNGD